MGQKKSHLPETRNPVELMEFLSKEMENPSFDEWLSELADKAIENDKFVWSFLYQVMRDVDSGRLSWGYHKRLLSGVVQILSRVGDSRAYRVIINYVKSLDRQIPIGALELISDLLPSFSEVDLDEILKIATHQDSLKSAFGILAILQLIVQGKLPTEKVEETKLFLKNYKNYVYYLDSAIEQSLDYLEAQEEPNLLTFFNEIAV
ncbi:hypothetical protein [Leptospira interrogans]|uniref:Uncharacterized protein n=1 Tax=Leptospira interrogans serovar Lora str. TE 1992 TaxID=1193028 RepID=M3EV41_LEPIR|nr:hypothetical protein [Leptospira interrogans]EMF41666.1 hypothetical protein LEP1GSC067_4218 [Leptospira interrogans serovar Lora str. TE 1992]AKH78098.1 hypothetical protein BRAT_14290 [Leptospira interrogans serovar Bratislava]EMJ55452.1 hypothetical protein LEP1GSC111_1467 [Leptospira interrogans str. UT126]EMN07157.1 hypothetical protein LEP1GSC053_0206 [Leptospira interrogans serovar Muenchen str. Brem 129]KLO76796.1 Uncharacterized protein AAY48_2070 [Leptospira interrogans serovar Mu